MKRVLLTGMSGTGKSSVIRELAARGYNATDADQPGWSEYTADGDWVWSEEPIQALLSEEGSGPLFLGGCATNQVKFHSQFDHIVLLSAQTDVIVERLATRTNNPYGKSPGELAEVLGYLETVEPLLRRVAGHEIDTRAPLAEVVAAILKLVEA